MLWRKYRAEISCEDFPSTFCPWIVHSGEKETPDCNGRGFSYGLESGDFVPKCLAVSDSAIKFVINSVNKILPEL